MYYEKISNYVIFHIWYESKVYAAILKISSHLAYIYRSLFSQNYQELTKNAKS